MYYDADQFVWNEQGWMTFQNPDYTYTKGIDVSTFQHEIDWNQVAESDIDFAMIRAGYRGAVEGLLHEDSEFQENVNGALQNNIDVGVYWYSSAINEEELEEEIEFLLSLIEPYSLAYPVAFDMEPYAADENGGRIHVLSQEERTKLALLFCEKMKQHGYDVLIYGNWDWLYNSLDFSAISNQEIWYAAYQNKPAMPDRFTMWQYSNNGMIPGIETTVDLNIFIQKKE
ncbi:MAG: GH25 family lysozyme [Bacillota bacterium]|nr:GH25 family lysozyme [Bacillota bacterium]